MQNCNKSWTPRHELGYGPRPKDLLKASFTVDLQGTCAEIITMLNNIYRLLKLLSNRLQDEKKGGDGKKNPSFRFAILLYKESSYLNLSQ